MFSSKDTFLNFYNPYLNFYNPNLNNEIPIIIPQSNNNLFTNYYDKNYNLITISESIDLLSNDKIFSNRIQLKDITKTELDIATNYPNIINNDHTTDNLIYDNSCCLVSKNYTQYGFLYNYTPLENENCNINNHELDHNNQLMFNNLNYWDNKYCKNNLDDQILGSCKNNNFECFDFVTKQQCIEYANNLKLNYFLKFDTNRKKINVTWSEKTCEGKIPYNIIWK
jgi:hypothetical protein